MLTFTIPGTPVGWKATGYNRARGTRYTRSPMRLFMERTRQAYQQVVDEQGVDLTGYSGRVRLSLVVYYSIPKSWPRGRRAAALTNSEPCCLTPDYTNVAKAVEDALTGHAYADDCQVVPGRHCDKLYGEPRVIVQLTYPDFSPTVKVGHGSAPQGSNA